MSQQISDKIRAVMRPSAAALEPYDPAFSEVRINLSANENTYGMPAEVREKVNAALCNVPTNRYPKPLSDELRAELASWHGVDPSQVIVGNGGDELLFNLFLAFGGTGRVLVNCPPTFSVYRLYAELAETTVVDIERDATSFSTDVDALVEASRNASMVIVTSPNNPTGGLFPKDGVRALCEACPGVVMMDEAYGEFAPEGSSAADLLGTYDNLVILHTLSKAFSLAGARLGYLIGSPSVMSALAAVRQPYSVNVFSQVAALVVAHERDAFAPTIEKIKSERERMYAELSSPAMAELGVTVWPSAANFLCVRLPQAHEARCRLRDEFSILVRDFSASAGLAGCLRITIGTPEENDAVLAALKTILTSTN